MGLGLSSPSPQVALDALVGSMEHPVVLLLPKQDVGLQQVLVEGVHAGSHAALLAHPLACLDVHHVPYKVRDQSKQARARQGAGGRGREFVIS